MVRRRVGRIVSVCWLLRVELVLAAETLSSLPVARSWVLAEALSLLAARRW